jgi:nitroreductase
LKIGILARFMYRKLVRVNNAIYLKSCVTFMDLSAGIFASLNYQKKLKKMSLIKDLNWRYATKNMTGKAVSDEQLNTILDAINLTATSYGLQPFSVIVVSNDAVKQKLQAAAYGQLQVGSSSHVLVFAALLKVTEADVQTFLDRIAAIRKMPMDALSGYKTMMMGTFNGLSEEQQHIWSAKQAYIALGTALAAAAEQKVDACPMEGFDAAQFDSILGLTAKGLKTVVIMPIGFRADGDATAHYAKVRKTNEELFDFVK